MTAEHGLPERIQRSRGTGWRKPADAVIVDRSSRWGNPFTVADAKATDPALDDATAHRQVVARFRAWLLGEAPNDQDVMPTRRNRAVDRRWMREHLADLRGHALCCPCPPDSACHADVLLDLANRPDRV